MSRPSFQFYHGDWRSNAKLRRCTRAERGDWIDVMCLLADSDEFGILRWPLKDLAQAVGCPVSSLKALIEKGVMKGANKGGRCGAFTYTSRHGGKDGPTVVLIPEQDGPVWYSSRMVRDDYIASIRGIGTRFGADKGDEPNKQPIQRIGDGPSSPSSASEVQKPREKSRSKSKPVDNSGNGAAKTNNDSGYWQHSEKATIAKGRTLDMEAGPGESWDAFRERINQRLAAKHRA